MVIINNYILNMSEEFWDKPEEFNPERFVEETFLPKTKVERRLSESSDSGIEDLIKNRTETLEKSKLSHNSNSQNSNMKRVLRVKKNLPHFLPFSIGKRTCIGQNLVRSFSFLMLGNLLQRYNVTSNDITLIKTHEACVALPPDTYPIALTPRNMNL